MISYFGEQKYWSISKWIMFDGILSILIGGFAIFESNMAERVFIIIFAIWILASAILRIFNGVCCKRFPRMDSTTYHGNYRIDYCCYFLVHKHASSDCSWDYTWNIFSFFKVLHVFLFGGLFEKVNLGNKDNFFILFSVKMLRKLH